MNTATAHVLQKKIPWENLKGILLEECIYWLLYAMGARDLHWRTGGRGQGAADGGRDLEATVYLSGPGGELTAQKWWIESKGRKSTVEKAVVMEAAHNASGHPGIDVLVIATNTSFSNPTVDWVKTWNAQKSTKVRLWDRNEIERHLSSHPDVVGRLFSQALSPQGRLEMLRTQFWNYGQRAESSLLKVVWSERDKLKWDIQDRIAVISSEIANGSITERAWGATLQPEELATVFIHALLNGPGMYLKLHRAGHGLDEYHEFLAYLLLNMLVSFKAEAVTTCIDSVWKDCEVDFPKEIQEMIISPMLCRLQGELFDVCVRDCHRVSTKPGLLSEDQAKAYWERLRIRDDPPKQQKEIFTMELKALECKVGFKKNDGCHFLRDDDTPLTVRLEKLQKTIQFRFEKYKNAKDDIIQKLLYGL